ncbi:MAG: hypothetical protein PHV23_03465 [Candidatus Gracilibacteria bacterium]|nr:hypothetical protein [Candidatus Gracilibacteria bacterium]
MSRNIHEKNEEIVKKIQGLFHIIPLKKLRNTDKVDFDVMSLYQEFNGIDIVTHEPGAKSPGSAGGKENLWYMHTGQEDNLITLSGNRYVELYTKNHGKIERFEISHNRIKWNGEIVLEGPGILGWPTGVFHRNYSPEGSVSMNFAVRDDKFNLDTEFNIYDLDVETGKFKVQRLGKLDQIINN